MLVEEVASPYGGEECLPLRAPPLLLLNLLLRDMYFSKKFE
jgi:hypothetical protein